MKIICAPDSFKESMTAIEAANAMAKGIESVLENAEIDLCPIADGGEGTVEALVAATDGQLQRTTVTGPLGEPVQATWGILGAVAEVKTAVIEMAAAAGLALVPAELRDPTRTTTFGAGELIKAALDAGAKKIILGIGGSSTTDGGCGCAQALGVKFIEETGQPITQLMAGGLLHKVIRVDTGELDPRIKDTQIVVACDVTNPLTGLDGAAHVYAPQKGADTRQVQFLDAGLLHMAEVWRQSLDNDVQQLPGAGAAGGMGGGMVAMLAATLAKGIELVLEAVAFSKRAAGYDLCLTGEGRIDGQTVSGKACIGVAQLADTKGVKTIALVGCAADDAGKTLDAGLFAYHVIGEGLSVEESMQRGEELLQAKAAQVVRQWSNRVRDPKL